MKKIELFKEVLKSFENKTFTIGKKTKKGYEIFVKSRVSNEKENFIGYLDLDNLDLPTTKDAWTIDNFLRKLVVDLQNKELLHNAIDVSAAVYDNSFFFLWKYDDWYKVVNKNTKIKVLRGYSYFKTIYKNRSCLVFDVKQNKIKKFLKEIEKIDKKNLLTVFAVENDNAFKDRILVSPVLERDYFLVYDNKYYLNTYVFFYYCDKELKNTLKRVKEVLG